MSRLIDADELVKRARPIENFPKGTMVVVLGVVKSLPTIDAEPIKHGHWVTTWNRYDKDGYVIQTRGRCSCCNQSSDVLDYCGNCGARMDEETE